tara:strand:- start:893 stop:1669 length:777 start_codon:yes stop_codon:yes gene_type:complete
MGFLPTDKEIKEQVSNYDDLTFFKKIKNIYVAAIVLICTLTYFLSDLFASTLNADASSVKNSIILYLILAAFIFYNHRWAMIVFCTIYIFDRVFLLFLQLSNPISEFIYAAVVVALTYGSFRVATELKRIKRDTDENALTIETQKKIETNSSLSFFKKTKNLYVIFITIYVLIVFFSSFYSGELVSVYIGNIIISLALAAFIYFNHRWAMILWGLLFSMLQILKITLTDGLFIQAFLIALIAFACWLTYNSVKDASDK